MRENGGQYTHAAIWATMAFAALDQSELAWELFDMINPVRHALTSAAVAIYQVEPYVMAADVYAVAPHQGRGGWTWYTGSAGWMYRLILESLLGLHVADGRLLLAPMLRPGWEGFTLQYHYRRSRYDIEVVRGPLSQSAIAVHCDQVLQDAAGIVLVDDGAVHQVQVVTAGAATAAATATATATP